VLLLGGGVHFARLVPSRDEGRFVRAVRASKHGPFRLVKRRFGFFHGGLLFVHVLLAGRLNGGGSSSAAGESAGLLEHDAALDAGDRGGPREARASAHRADVAAVALVVAAGLVKPHV